MDVIALVGPSGTGKSHRALWVAQQNGADAIIDDGILIKDGKDRGHLCEKRKESDHGGAPCNLRPAGTCIRCAPCHYGIAAAADSPSRNL